MADEECPEPSFVKSLEPRIYGILRGPDVDFDSISAKRIRATLIEETPDLEGQIKSNKKWIDQVITAAFFQVQAEVGSSQGPSASVAVSPVKRKRSPDDGDAPTLPTSQPVPIKKKKGLTDEELARQLDREINQATRTTRTGRTRKPAASSKGARKKSTNGRSHKSEKYVVESGEEGGAGTDDSFESDDSADEDHVPEKKKRRSDGTPKRGGGGFNKPWALSEQLTAVVGETQLSRPQVVKVGVSARACRRVTLGKHLWAYIKSNELQNPKKKNEIICDDKLNELFGVKKVTAFSMNKYIGKHLYALEDEEVEGSA